MCKIILELSTPEKTRWEKEASEYNLTIGKWIKDVGNQRVGDIEFLRNIQEIENKENEIMNNVRIQVDRSFLKFLFPEKEKK